MINEAIQSFLNAIGQKATDFWTGLWAPIFDSWPFWWSWGVFLLILLACFVIGFFLQFKWPRLILGLIVGGAAAWLFGRVTMYNELKAKLDAERKKKPPPKPQEPQGGGGIFGGWR